MKLNAVILSILLVAYSLTSIKGNPELFDQEKLLEHLETLSSDAYEGRLTGEKGNALARTYIIDHFKESGIAPFGKAFEQPFEFTRGEMAYKANNVLGFVKGTTYPGDFIVISAHHDHLGKHGDAIYNGADDNASGVAALLAFAEYFAANPPKHSVILAAFDAEELGLEGAKYFMTQTEDINIVLNVNMDMIGRSTKDELYVVGSRYHKSLAKMMAQFENPTSSKLLVGHDGADQKEDWTYASDHSPFHIKEIPFLYFGNEDHPAYHKPTDTFDAITPEFYKNAVTIIISVFKAADQIEF